MKKRWTRDAVSGKTVSGALLSETGLFCRRILPENDAIACETCRINPPELEIPHREQRKPESGLFDTRKVGLMIKI